MSPSEPHDWQSLTQLTSGAPLVVERVSLPQAGVALVGAWTLPELARLSHEDQVFVAAFVRAHGSIKEMERVFGVSYPTIKARLNRIAATFEFEDLAPAAPAEGSRTEVLDRLQRGEITAEAAIAALRGARP